jgi:carboxymethylenebutenolidase
MGGMIKYTRPDGTSVDGYLVEAQGGAAAPGIVVIQEWWGLNEQIRGVADKLAAAGYRALVPDLYRGQVALEENEAKHLMQGLDFGSAKVGVTGFCMGGALTVLAAVNVPEGDAFVVWYGCPPLEYVDAAKIKAPLQAHFGDQDSVFPIAQATELAGKLQAAGARYELYTYPAKHAFANETADAKNLPYLGYNAQAAAQAWERTFAFLGTHLR